MGGANVPDPGEPRFNQCQVSHLPGHIDILFCMHAIPCTQFVNACYACNPMYSCTHAHVQSNDPIACNPTYPMCQCPLHPTHTNLQVSNTGTHPTLKDLYCNASSPPSLHTHTHMRRHP